MSLSSLVHSFFFSPSRTPTQTSEGTKRHKTLGSHAHTCGVYMYLHTKRLGYGCIAPTSAVNGRLHLDGGCSDATAPLSWSLTLALPPPFFISPPLYPSTPPSPLPSPDLSHCVLPYPFHTGGGRPHQLLASTVGRGVACGVGSWVWRQVMSEGRCLCVPSMSRLASPLPSLQPPAIFLVSRVLYLHVFIYIMWMYLYTFVCACASVYIHL